MEASQTEEGKERKVATPLILGPGKQTTLMPTKFSEIQDQNLYTATCQDDITLPLDGCAEKDVDGILERVLQETTERNKYFIGLQETITKVWDTKLTEFVLTHQFNAGDPFDCEKSTSPHLLNFEKEVILYFARLWNLSPADAWGYLASGSTEALMYAMHNAHSYFDSFEMSKAPVVIYSTEAHYSVANNATLLRIAAFFDEAKKAGISPPDGLSSWPRGVPVHERTRKMDLSILQLVVNSFAKLGYPVIVFFTCGTSIGQAIDDVQDGCRIVEEACSSNNVPYWVHVDCALLGVVLPFINNELSAPVQFDFSLPQVRSMNVSGHKWYGMSWPCSVYLTRRTHCFKPSKEFATCAVSWELGPFGCTRSSNSAILLWYILTTKTKEMQTQVIKQQLKLTEYAFNKVTNNNVLNQYSKPHRTHQFALNIILTVPDEQRFFRKYSLSRLPQKGLTQIHIMPHVTQELVDVFLQDLEDLIKAAQTPIQ